MKKSTNNIKKEKNNLNFSLFGEKKGENPTVNHKSNLGLDIPDDYFQHSKNEILGKLPKKETSRNIFGLKPLIAYPIAASLLLLIGMSLWFQFSTKPIKTQTTNIVIPENAILVNSLFIDEDNMDNYMDDYILHEIFVEVALAEQKLDNIFINSLFIEDTHIDDYLNESFVDHLLF